MEKRNTAPLPSFSSPLLPEIFSPPPPSQFSLSIHTTSTNDFSFSNDDMFFEKPVTDLVKVEDFGPSLYEWLGIPDEDVQPVERPVKHPLPSLPPEAIVLESSKAVAPSQNSSFSLIPSHSDIATDNNNNGIRVIGFKRPAEFIVGDGENESLRSYEPDDEENNIRLKLRSSTMASIVASMRMTNRKNESNLPKFAFLTESESENLEDGYKWRKYGQKSVRNSQFPRSYYRCTTIGCNVKKRVERWSNDPTHVMTTYEGLHLHDLPPIIPLPSRSFSLHNNSATVSKPPRVSGQPKDAIAVANAGEHANNIITSVHVRTVGGDSGGRSVSDGGLQRTVAVANEFMQQAVTPTILQNFNLSAPQVSLGNVTPTTITNNNHYQSSSMSVYHDNNHYEDFFGGEFSNNSYMASSYGGGEDLMFKKETTDTGLLEDILNFSSIAPHHGHHHQPIFL